MIHLKLEDFKRVPFYFSLSRCVFVCKGEYAVCIFAGVARHPAGRRRPQQRLGAHAPNGVQLLVRACVHACCPACSAFIFFSCLLLVCASAYSRADPDDSIPLMRPIMACSGSGFALYHSLWRKGICLYREGLRLSEHSYWLIGTIRISGPTADYTVTTGR